MTTAYSEAHQRLNCVLQIFVVVEVAGICIAAINYAWWFAADLVHFGMRDRCH